LEIVGIDVVPFTLPNGEKKNIQLAIDYFSKEIKAIPANTSGNCIVEAFESEIEWIERCPSTIISDNGSNLTSDVFKTYLLKFFYR